MITARTFRPILRSTLFAALFLALLAASLHSAGAQPKGGTKGDPSSAGTVQALACEGLGGHADVGEVRTPGSGLISTTVKCNGGMADGMTCTNTANGSNCTHRVAPGSSGKPDAGMIAFQNMVAQLSGQPATATPGPAVVPAVDPGSTTVLEPLDS